MLARTGTVNWLTAHRGNHPPMQLSARDRAGAHWLNRYQRHANTALARANSGVSDGAQVAPQAVTSTTSTGAAKRAK